MKILNQDIRDKNFKNIYLLIGDEKFLIKSYKHRLKSAIVEDDMNYNYFEGKQADVSEFIAIAQTLPFFAERRCIIAENTSWFKRESDKLAEFLEDIPSSTCIIFIEEDVDKRSALYRKIKSLAYVAELNKRESSELKNWIASYLKRYDKLISLKDAELIIEYVGLDMNSLSNELEKLIAYTKDKNVIERQDIEAIVSISLQNKIFDMISFIVVKKYEQALDIYADLLVLRESPLRILGLLSKQFDKLLYIKDMLELGMNKKEIAEAVRLPEYVAVKLMKQCRGFDRKKLHSYLSKCIEMEYSIKSGLINERLAVELMLAGD